MLLLLSNDVKIKSTIWRSYFSYYQGIKSANSKLFKDFYDEDNMEKNKPDSGLYFDIITIA